MSTSGLIFGSPGELRFVKGKDHEWTSLGYPETMGVIVPDETRNFPTEVDKLL